MNPESGIVSKLVSDAIIPKMIRIRQNFPRPVIKDLPKHIAGQLQLDGIAETIKPGMNIAITCGSRGISNIQHIIREICNFVKLQGAAPFILPSMGSHGGASAEGQRKIIEGYGVTEEFCGAPIKASTEVIEIGITEEYHHVFINKNAANADGIIVVGRIKPHTDFRGPYESGIMKMMVIGLGGQHGAQVFHQNGPKYMAHLLPLFGNVIIKNAPILFAIGIIENAYNETAKIVSIPRDKIAEMEPELLKEARTLMGRLLFDEVDVLIVDRVGKDISGDGMDPNITGTFSTPYATGGLKAKKRVVLDLTDETRGNMVGIGMADTTTLRCFHKCDFEASYPNALTCTVFDPFRIPLIMKNDKEAISACLKYGGENDKENPRVMRIQDTMHITEIWISEAMLKEAEANPSIEILSAPQSMPFDKNGNLW